MVVITIMYSPSEQSFTHNGLVASASVFVKTLRRCGLTDTSKGGEREKKEQIAANKAARTLHV